MFKGSHDSSDPDIRARINRVTSEELGANRVLWHLTRNRSRVARESFRGESADNDHVRLFFFYLSLSLSLTLSLSLFLLPLSFCCSFGPRITSAMEQRQSCTIDRDVHQPTTSILELEIFKPILHRSETLTIAKNMICSKISNFLKF